MKYTIALISALFCITASAQTFKGTFYGNGSSLTNTSYESNYTGTASVLASNTLSSSNILRLVSLGNLAGDNFGGAVALQRFNNLMISNNAATIYLCGDSTVAGDAITNTSYLPQNILARVFSARTASSISIVNVAVSGQNVEAWRTNGNLATVISASPDVIINRYGINDGPQEPTRFEQNYRLALATIRSNLPITRTAIICVTPEYSSDDQNSRGIAWNTYCDYVIRKAAWDYGCAFYNGGKDFRDAYTNGWYLLQHPAGNFGGIHQLETAKARTWSGIADYMMPDALSYTWANRPINVTAQYVIGFTNPSSGTFPGYLSSDFPSNYANGLSMFRATGVQGWTNDGATFTFKQSDGVWFQFDNQYSGSGIRVRTGQTSGWNTFWNLLAIDDLGKVNLGSSSTITFAAGNHAGNAGAAPVIKLGDSVSSAVNFPLSVDFGATYGNSADGSINNRKITFYNDGVTIVGVGENATEVGFYSTDPLAKWNFYYNGTLAWGIRPYGVVMTGTLTRPTNAAPSNVTIGITAPDAWVPETNSGVKMWSPRWINH